MKKQLKNYKKLDKKIMNEIKKSEENSDDVTIELYLTDHQKIYNEFSSIQKSRINSELISYLENEIKYKSIDKTITIEVETKTQNEKFIKNLENLVKDSVIEDIDDLNYDLKRNYRISSTLCIAGFIVLGFISLFSYLSDYYVFNEFFVIVSWVLIWQFVEMYFFERPELKHKKMKLMQLYFAEFRYKRE